MSEKEREELAQLSMKLRNCAGNLLDAHDEEIMDRLNEACADEESKNSIPIELKLNLGRDEEGSYHLNTAIKVRFLSEMKDSLPTCTWNPDQPELPLATDNGEGEPGNEPDAPGEE